MAQHRPWRWALGGALAIALTWVLMAGRLLVVERSVGTPDAIVSLASHEWERLPEAASLAARYPDALVVLTYPRDVTDKNCHDCAHRAEWLAAAGVSPERIRVLPLTAGGTYGEATAFRTFASSRRVTKVLVVTSPYHARRALNVFRTVLSGLRLDVGVQPALLHSAIHPNVWWFYGYDRWYVAYEWAASAYYVLRYDVPVS
jgi:uncharacterized SAM-binding protein YcdF (DUF218 family)